MADAGLRVHWQYCRDGWDITGDVFREDDADQVRAWEGDFCLIEVTRNADGRWRPTGGDLHGWVAMAEHSYGGPSEALSYILGGATWLDADDMGSGWEIDGSDKNIDPYEVDRRIVSDEMRKREIDQANLDKALDEIRWRVTWAETAHFTTSDQGLYGFRLADVTYGGGESAAESLDLTVYRELQDAVNDYLVDIDWDGVMGENGHGDAQVSLGAPEVGPTGTPGRPHHHRGI